MDQQYGLKRKRLPDLPSQRPHREQRRSERSHDHGSGRTWNKSDQARINQMQEEQRHREFLAQEGDFVLRQKRKAAEIRVVEGRPQPIDWLTVILRVIDPQEDLINDDFEEHDLEYIEPETVLDGLTAKQLQELRKEIEEFMDLEHNAKNRDYWRTMRIMCKHQQKKLSTHGPDGRAVGSVSVDIERLLGSKSYEDLERLEQQIKDKLDSDEPIDTDYWQHLLEHLLVHKAKAKLKTVYNAVLDSRLTTLQRDNSKAAAAARSALTEHQAEAPTYRKLFDPDPSLQISSADKALGILDEKEFLDKIASERHRIMKMRYVPRPKNANTGTSEAILRTHQAVPISNGYLEQNVDGTESQAATALFDHEAAKGVEEDEEVFVGEEEVETKNKAVWMGKYRPRKPKYFNRVQMGYEWNKYNQTHYDHENPPPKVVQGYKFHIFYPELIDKMKAPTYVITREGGRKKGQTLAPAGEEDTCIIRFMSGPPYEDIAFRIVDRDWDYSAKYDRGFKNTFERGVLTLHFSFKKTYYRK